MTSNRINNYSEIATNVENNLPPNRKTVAILTDSKGDYLGRNVSNVMEADILWWSKGCTTERGFNWLVIEFNEQLCIYIWLGTCDITEKEGDI